MEKTLLGMSDAWAASYKDFEASGKTKSPPESQRSSELLQFPEIESAPGRACRGRANRVSITNIFSATDVMAAQSCSQCGKS